MEKYRTEGKKYPETAGWFSVIHEEKVYEGRTDGCIIFLRRVEKSEYPLFYPESMKNFLCSPSIFSVELEKEKVRNVIARFQSLYHTKPGGMNMHYPFSLKKNTLDEKEWRRSTVKVTLHPNILYFSVENENTGDGKIYVEVENEKIYSDFWVAVSGEYLESAVKAFSGKAFTFSLTKRTWKLENEEGIVFILPITLKEKKEPDIEKALGEIREEKET